MATRRTIQTNRERRAGSAAGNMILRRFSAVISDCNRLVSSDMVPQSTKDNCINRLETQQRILGRAHGPIFPDDIVRDLQQILAETLDTVRNATVREEGNRGYRTPRAVTSNGGAPRYIITECQLKFLIECGFKITRMAELLGVSASVVKRRMTEYNLTIRGQYENISDDALDELVRQATNGNRLIGAEGIRAKLLGQGHRIQRERVRQSVLRIDAGGAAIRTAPPIQRRTYTVAGPNSMWHVDGNHKLIRWKFVIHGGIDGYSRYLTFLKLSINNRKETVLGHFLQGVAECGLPSRVRVDKGGENTALCNIMEMLRGHGRGSFIRARSVHNQRIERAWVDVWKDVTNLFYDLFHFFESERTLDVDDDVSMWALHYIYHPRIDRELQCFRSQWNNHGLRTAHHETPLQLFVGGALALVNSGHTAIADLFNRGNAVDYNADAGVLLFDEGEEADAASRVLVPEIHCPLDEDALARLREEIDPLAPSADLGFDLYLQTLDFINNHIH